MEPMALGSPTGSPSPATGSNSSFLPPYLMGESPLPRTNTLSPTKGRSLSFAQSPTNAPTSPDFNRSNIHQKSFLGYQQSPSQNIFSPSSNNNKSIIGPPTQGLFDSLQAEKLSVHHTPTRGFNNNPQQTIQQVTSPNQSLVHNHSYMYNQSYNNDSFLNQSHYNSPRITSPLQQNELRSNSIYNIANCVSPRNIDFWVTVYGFPPNATSLIISHFSQCGNIVDKSFPPQNGNWIHLKFSSRLECDKALNYNEKILSNNLMIGVTRCKDPSIVEKENIDNSEAAFNRVRPLNHAGYKSVQHPTEVVPGVAAPKKNSGLVNKAMDLFFGW